MAWSSSLKSLLTVFVFSILAVSSVDSYYECTKSNCDSASCASTTCAATKGCFNQIQNFHGTSTDRTLRVKGCSEDTCSPLEFSATLGDKQKFRYRNSCCSTEQCNKDDLTLPTESSEPNGVECSACYNEKEGKCSSVTTLKCTGNEKKCVEVTGTYTGTSNLALYGKGCATENTCSLNTIVMNNIQIKSTCISTSGSPTLKAISSIPMVFLLLKVFL